MKKTKFLLSLVAILVLAGCAKNNPTNGDKVIIGTMAPLTGKYAIYGSSATNGIKLALEEIEKSGGILGKKIDYILQDDKGEITDAKNVYGSLVEKNVDAILGGITSGISYAIGEDANADQIPTITPTATQLNVTQARPYVFRVAYVDPYQGQIIAKYIKDKNLGKNVAIMRNTSSDYSNGVADAFIEDAKKNGLNIIKEVSYGEDDKDFKAQLTDIKQSNPDVLVLPDYYEKIALISSQIKEIGLDTKLLGPDGWDGVLQTLNGDTTTINKLNGAIFSSHYSKDDKNEKVAKFVKAYREKYNEEPTAFSALGYDSAYLLKEAMEKAGTTDKVKVKDAIKNIQFKGITGSIKFDDNNNPIKDVTMIEIKDGKYAFNSIVKN